jgi:hypothetical protein
MTTDTTGTKSFQDSGNEAGASLSDQIGIEFLPELLDIDFDDHGSSV